MLGKERNIASRNLKNLFSMPHKQQASDTIQVVIQKAESPQNTVPTIPTVLGPKFSLANNFRDFSSPQSTNDGEPTISHMLRSKMKNRNALIKLAHTLDSNMYRELKAIRTNCRYVSKRTQSSG